MRYIDSSKRSKDQALGYWIDKESASFVSHLRVQTGYFSVNGLSGFSDIIKALVNADLPIHAAIGSNEKDTTQSDIEALIDLVGCPRPRAKVCIISYSGGLFHPKVVHLTRTDGSQLAYVGSANLTPAGVGARNIEAGVLLDTKDGDPCSILDEISARIDSWIFDSRPEASIVATQADVQKLTDNGILGLVKPARSPGTGGAGSSSSGPTTSLAPLVKFPPIATSSVSASPLATSTSAPASTLPSSSSAPHLGNEVLIAEIGGGSRWKQANFPIAIMQNYFGVNPVANDHVKLHEVDSSGAVGDIVDTQVVNVKSQNYRIELSTVSGKAYPTTGRPIGVFRKIAPKEFRYRVFMPSDPAHSTLDSYLLKKYTGPSRQLKRVIIDGAELSKLWPSCPV